MDKLLEEPPSQEFVDGILEFYFAVRDFLNIAELVDENYVTYVSTDEDGKFRMKLFCVNPAAKSAEMPGPWSQHGIFFGNTSAACLLQEDAEYQK